MDSPAACRQFRIEHNLLPALEMMRKNEHYTFCMECTLHVMELLEAHPELRGGHESGCKSCGQRHSSRSTGRRAPQFTLELLSMGIQNFPTALQIGSPRLFGDERVWPGLDHAPVDAFRAQNTAQP